MNMIVQPDCQHFQDDLVIEEVLQDFHSVVIGSPYFMHECDMEGGHSAADVISPI